MKLGILPKSLMKGSMALLIFAAILFVLWVLEYFLIVILGLNLGINNNDLWIIMPILATIITVIYVYEKERDERKENEYEKQLDLLKILFEELDFLEDTLEKYKETFSKRKGYPLWELWDIDISTYFKNLRHKINDKDTFNLKKNLMKIKDKLLVINNLKNYTKQLEESRGDDEIIKQLGIIKINREQITKFIDETLPLIKTSKRLCKKFSN